MKNDQEGAGLEYFSQLYGATTLQGEPQQTLFDKWRDRILFRTYEKYSTNKLSESESLMLDVVTVGC